MLYTLAKLLTRSAVAALIESNFGWQVRTFYIIFVQKKMESEYNSLTTKSEAEGTDLITYHHTIVRQK